MKRTLIIILLFGRLMGNVDSKPIFQSDSPSSFSTDGETIKALKIACDDFLVNGKDVKDFNVILSNEIEENKTDEDDLLIITFMGKLAPGKRGLGTANRAPGSITYFVSKTKWKIIKKQGIR